MKRISNLSRRLLEAQGSRCESGLITRLSNNDRFLLPTRTAGCVGTASFSMSRRVLSPSRDASQGDEEVQPGIFRMATSMAQARSTSSDIVLERAVQERSPITKALWEIRNAEIKFQVYLCPTLSTSRWRGPCSYSPSQEKRRAAGQEITSQPPQPVPPSLSRSAVHYPFSSDPYLREEYRNASGLVRVEYRQGCKMAFIGRILEDLDALAGNVAFKHCSEDPSFPLLVTASVDRIVLKRHPRLDSDITLVGRAVWTGRSSMVINMRCVSSAPGECYVGEDPWGRDENCWLDANFTFVARDRETGRSRSVSPLDLGDCQYQGDAKEDDLQKGWKAIWKRVQAHKDRQSLERKAAKKDAASLVEVEVARVRREAEAEKLVEAGFPLLHLPALADPHAVLLRQTALSSTMICMPQHRNTADRIFGGFLMHRAYELGFCTAFMFGGSRPTFSEIDEVVFVQAVDVGDLVRLEACVLYTKSGKDSNGNDIPQACVEVLASVVRPQSVESKVSNRFNLTFSFPDVTLVGCSRPLLRTVLPADATEASRIVMAKHRESLHETVDEEEAI